MLGKGKRLRSIKNVFDKFLNLNHIFLRMMVPNYILRPHKSKIKNIPDGTEETTSGVKRLKSLESKRQLMYPTIAVNDANTKHMFDNRYGTGQSTIDGILRTTGLFLDGNNICGICFVLCLHLVILILIHPFPLR